MWVADSVPAGLWRQALAASSRTAKATFVLVGHSAKYSDAAGRELLQEGCWTTAQVYG